MSVDLENARTTAKLFRSLKHPRVAERVSVLLLAALEDAEETSLARGRLLDDHRAGCEWLTRAKAAMRERDELEKLVPDLRDSLATAHDRACRYEKSLDELHGRLTAAVDRVIEIKEWHGKALEERDAARAVVADTPETVAKIESVIHDETHCVCAGEGGHRGFADAILAALRESSR